MEDVSQADYTAKVLRKLNPKLRSLNTLNYTQEQQIIISRNQVDKISIQGVQPKYSVRLNLKNECFDLVEKYGTFIVKPQNPEWVQFPENEAFTMHMADHYGIETPLNGLVRCSDGSLSYFIKRFDRIARNKKLHVEDFSQLAELNRKKKYNYSVEKLMTLIETYCSFPKVEMLKIFRLLLFNFVFGNEDMHLKNYSIITTKKGVIQLSPAYDLLNTTAVYRFYDKEFKDIEQSALTINGKKNNLKSNDFKLMAERMKLQTRLIDQAYEDLNSTIAHSYKLINKSFMSDDMKKVYLEVLKKNSQILFS